MASYNELISSYIRRQGGDDTLVAAVVDYLDNAHPSDEPPWSVEFDDICQAAVAFANSKQERLRKHKRATASKTKPAAVNSRHRQSLAQEAHSIRLALRRPSSKREIQSMIARLEQLEKLIADSRSEAK
jgi:hypothetical protein